MGDPFNEVQVEVEVALGALQSSSGWPARWVGLSVCAVPSVHQQLSDIFVPVSMLW